LRNLLVAMGAINIGINIERVNTTVNIKFVQSMFSLFFRMFLLDLLS